MLGLLSLCSWTTFPLARFIGSVLYSNSSGKPDLKEGIYFGAELGEEHLLVKADTPIVFPNCGDRFYRNLRTRAVYKIVVIFTQRDIIQNYNSAIAFLQDNVPCYWPPTHKRQPSSSAFSSATTFKGFLPFTAAAIAASYGFLPVLLTAVIAALFDNPRTLASHAART